MARRRRDLVQETPPLDPEGDYRRLCHFAVSFEEETYAAIRGERDRLDASALPASERFGGLRAFYGDLGLGAAADRHLAHLRRAAERWPGGAR